MNTSGLRPHQPAHTERLFGALLKYGAALDASDPGTGKTYCACAVAREMKVVAVVVCPFSVVHTWRAVGRLLGIELEVVNYEAARGRTFKINWHDPKVFGPSFKKHTESEYGYLKVAGKGSRWVWKYEFVLVIFDEVQRCAGETSILSKMLIAARRQCTYVLALSATAASKPSQLKALGYALRLFELKEYRWWLLARGCKPGYFGGIVFSEKPEEQQKAMLKIHNEIASRGSRMRKDEIPGFPKTQIEVRLVDDVSGRALLLAEDIRADYLRRMEQSEDGSAPVIVQNIRAYQALELLLVDVLVETFEDAVETSKVAIFVNYSATVDALIKRLSKKYKVGQIDGRNASTRSSVEAAFQRNELDGVVANNAAGGVGLNLHDPTGEVERTVEIVPCYSADTIRQVLGRVQRDRGAFSRQFFFYFKDTLQEKTAQSLSQKLNNLDLLNDAELHGAF